jgi:phosphate transport system substrate-binding protein
MNRRMRRRTTNGWRGWIGVLALSVAWACGARAADRVRVTGSPILEGVIGEALEQLEADGALSGAASFAGGTPGGFAAMEDRKADVLLLGRALSAEDRAAAPRIDFVPHYIGEQVAAWVVSKDAWEWGVRQITLAQARDLYANRMKTWEPFAGRRDKMFCVVAPEGGGVWELFATWAFGGTSRAPAGGWKATEDAAELRAAVDAPGAAIGLMPLVFADRVRAFPLAVEAEPGRFVEATPAAVADGSYPMRRPLYLITDGRPVGGRRALIEFFAGDRGRALLRKHGMLPAGDLPPRPGAGQAQPR